MNHLNSAAFLNKFSTLLRTKMREQYTSFKLGHVGQPTFEDLLIFVHCVSIDLKSDPDCWKEMNQEKKTEENRSRSDKKVPPPRVSVKEQNSTPLTSTQRPRNSNSNQPPRMDYPCNYYHQNGYTLYKCNEYMALNRQQWEHVIAQRNWCTNCFSLKHTLIGCPSLKTCLMCQGNITDTFALSNIHRTIHHALLLVVWHVTLRTLQLQPPPEVPLFRIAYWVRSLWKLLPWPPVNTCGWML